MITKRIINYGGENRIKEFDKYEFEINIVTANELIDNCQNKTIIIVEKEMDVDKVIDSIIQSADYPGLITTTIADLYNVFNNSGLWKFKHIIKDNKKDVITEVSQIKSNKIFVVCLVGYNDSLFDCSDIIEQVRTENEYVYFALPVIYEENDKVEVCIFYK